MGLPRSRRSPFASAAALLGAATVLAGCTPGTESAAGPPSEFTPAVPTASAAASSGAASSGAASSGAPSSGAAASGGHLILRPVIGSEPTTPQNCPPAAPAPEAEARLCDLAGTMLYHLGPVALDGAATSVEATTDASGRPVILVNLNPASAQHLTDLTAGHIGTAYAMLGGARVISAPTVQSAITGGTLQISGNFTPDEADRIAQQLRTS